MAKKRRRHTVALPARSGPAPTVVLRTSSAQGAVPVKLVLEREMPAPIPPDPALADLALDDAALDDAPLDDSAPDDRDDEGFGSGFVAALEIGAYNDSEQDRAAPMTPPMREQETTGMTRTFISMAKTGGQGKTLVAQMLVLQHEQKGAPTKLAAADSDTLNHRSKFGRLFPGVKELGIGEELTKIKTSTDPNLAIKYWDEFGRTLLESGTIIDVGANVAAELFSWAEARNAGSLLRRRNSAPIDLIVPTKAEGQAIEDARALIQYSFDKNEWLPIGRRFVILNEVAGGFAPYESDPAFRRLRAFAGMGVQVITMKRCESDIWNLLEKEMISIRDALKLTETDLEKRYGIDVWTGHGGLTDLKAWAEETLAAFEKAGLTPSRAAMPTPEAVNCD